MENPHLLDGHDLPTILFIQSQPRRSSQIPIKLVVADNLRRYFFRFVDIGRRCKVGMSSNIHDHVGIREQRDVALLK